MGEFPRKSDGRRVFTVEFKRGVVQQLLNGDKTLAELSRELDISPSVIRNWKGSPRRAQRPPSKPVRTSSPSASCARPMRKIRELERARGRKTMEVEIVRAAQEIVKKLRRCAESPRGDAVADDTD